MRGYLESRCLVFKLFSCIFSKTSLSHVLNQHSVVGANNGVINAFD